MPERGAHPIGSMRRSRPLEHRELAHAEAVEQLQRPLVLVAEVLGHVGIGGQRHRPAGLQAHLEEGPRRVDLARPACAARRSRPRLPPRSRLCPPSRARNRGADRAPGSGAPEPHTLTRSGWARMSNIPVRGGLAQGLEVAAPHLVGVAAAPDVNSPSSSAHVDAPRRAGSGSSPRRSPTRARRAGSAIRSSRPGTKSASMPSLRSVSSRTKAQYSSRSSCAQRRHQGWVQTSSACTKR